MMGTSVGFLARQRGAAALVVLMVVVASLLAGEARAEWGMGVCTDAYDDDPFLEQNGRPGPEYLDGLDNDCDGAIDNGDVIVAVQLAMVGVAPDTAEVGEVVQVTGLARTHPSLAGAVAAEYRIGDGDWWVLPNTEINSYPRDYALSAWTPPLETPGQFDVCIRASAHYQIVPPSWEPADVDSEEVCVTLTVTGDVTFEGFFAPVDMADQPIHVRAGRTLPLKFALLDGLDPITDAAQVAVSSVPVADGCELSGESQSEVVEDEGAGHSGLRYDTDDEQFVFAWDTLRSWAGTCRAVEVRVDGGLVGGAEFMFSR